MIDLWQNCIRHIPVNHIPREDCCYLGWCDNYSTYLVYEDWKIRAYTFEEWADVDNHLDENWRAEIWEYFWESTSYLDKDTIEYIELELEWDAVDIAKALLSDLQEQLEDVSYRIYDTVDWVDIPSERLVGFIRSCMEKVKLYKGNLAYTYYK